MIFLILVFEIIDAHFWKKGLMEEETQQYEKVGKRK